MKVSKLRIEVQLGPHEKARLFYSKNSLYPKFEADFRQFYLKTIVSCEQNDRIFQITTKEGENIILKTFKDQLPAFARNFDFY